MGRTRPVRAWRGVIAAAAGCAGVALAFPAAAPAAWAAAGPARQATAAHGLTIRSVSPHRARAGQQVTITGTGLRKVTSVAMHGVRASFRLASGGRLVAIVPRKATSGPLTVRAGKANATAIVAIVPTVTGFSPPSGRVGSEVDLTGTDFTPPCTVSFGSVAAACTVIGPLNIVTAVPAGAVTAPIRVTTSGSTLTTTGSFTVTVPQVSVQPASGPPGATVTVTGSGFDANQDIDLYAGTTNQAIVVTSSAGAFSYSGFVIPASAQPGNVWVSAVEPSSGLSAQASFLVQVNWPEQGFGAAGGRFNLYEDTLSPADAGSLAVAWTHPTGSAVESSPAIAGGVAYVGSDNDDVYALNAATGAVLWSYATGGPVYSSPAVAGGVVYVGSEDGSVYALNAATGAVLWSRATGGAVHSSPAVAGGVVYVGSDNGSVYALGAATGTVLWSYATGAAVFSSPAVAAGVVYVGSDNDDVYALSAATGSVLWSYVTGSAVVSSPAVANGVVYAGSEDGNEYALSAATGAELWSFATGCPVQSSPAVAAGVVYVGSYDSTGQVYALSAATGAELWSASTGAYVVDASPAVAGGVVYVGTDSSTVQALSAATGAELWSYTTGNSVTSSPAVVGGEVYVGSDDGSLYAFDLPAGIGPMAGQARPAISALHPDRALRVSR
jgi:outer membrane protein assembly factor BamB